MCFKSTNLYEICTVLDKKIYLPITGIVIIYLLKECCYICIYMITICTYINDYEQMYTKGINSNIAHCHETLRDVTECSSTFNKR